MNPLVKKYLVALFILLPVLAAAQKSKSSVPIILPKAGTVLINTYYVTDSSGAHVPKDTVDPEMPDDTQRVVYSGIESHGRPHCITLTGPSNEDTNVLSYAKNGDVWQLNTGRGSKWLRFPFGLPSGKRLTSSPKLNKGSVLGKAYEELDHDVTQVVGHDTVTIMGKPFDCIKLQVLHIKVYKGSSFPNVETDWYSPQLGYIVRANFGWGGSYFLNQQVKSYIIP
jgi:hypothetical protein